MNTMGAVIAAAGRCGLRIHLKHNRLVIAGPRKCACHARRLRSREQEIIAYARKIRNDVTGLEWKTAATGYRAMPCVICGNPALLRHPRSPARPMHKTCADTLARLAGDAE